LLTDCHSRFRVDGIGQSLSAVFSTLVCLCVASSIVGPWKSVKAQSVQPPPVYGFGSATCATFLADVRLRGDQARALYFSAQGFISAANALLQSVDYPMVRNLTAKLGLDAQQRTIGQMCEANPNQEFSRAVMELLDRIREADADTAYIVWKAETADNRFERGTDTFIVQNGKIMTQTFAAKISPKR
jgi:hypothetical protein